MHTGQAGVVIPLVELGQKLEIIPVPVLQNLEDVRDLPVITHVLGEIGVTVVLAVEMALSTEPTIVVIHRLRVAAVTSVVQAARQPGVLGLTVAPHVMALKHEGIFVAEWK
jgi:hypothetical protein